MDTGYSSRHSTESSDSRPGPATATTSGTRAARAAARTLAPARSYRYNTVTTWRLL